MTYRVDEPVTVAARAHSGHHRTPSYIKGRTGRIERVHAAFRNPRARTATTGSPRCRCTS